jgi:hypothetical protein
LCNTCRLLLALDRGQSKTEKEGELFLSFTSPSDFYDSFRISFGNLPNRAFRTLVCFNLPALPRMLITHFEPTDLFALGPAKQVQRLKQADLPMFVVISFYDLSSASAVRARFGQISHHLPIYTHLTKAIISIFRWQWLRCCQVIINGRKVKPEISLHFED